MRDVANYCDAGERITSRTIWNVGGDDAHQLEVRYTGECGSPAYAVDRDSIHQVCRIVLEVRANPAGEEGQSRLRDRGKSKPSYLDAGFYILVVLHQQRCIGGQRKVSRLENDARCVLPLIEVDCSVGMAKKHGRSRLRVE